MPAPQTATRSCDGAGSCRRAITDACATVMMHTARRRIDLDSALAVFAVEH